MIGMSTATGAAPVAKIVTVVVGTIETLGTWTCAVFSFIRETMSRAMQKARRAFFPEMRGANPVQ